MLRADGAFVPTAGFQRLDRYREHDVELVVADLLPQQPFAEAVVSQGQPAPAAAVLERALKLGKGACFVAAPDGTILSWLSTERTDPATGEAFPSLDPKHFSWNSAMGWCPTCRGHGRIYAWLRQMDEDIDARAEEADLGEGEPCPDCHGARLNPVARAVHLHLQEASPISLPQLLALPAADVLAMGRGLGCGMSEWLAAAGGEQK